MSEATFHGFYEQRESRLDSWIDFDERSVILRMKGYRMTLLFRILQMALLLFINYSRKDVIFWHDFFSRMKQSFYRKIEKVVLAFKTSYLNWEYRSSKSIKIHACTHCWRKSWITNGPDMRRLFNRWIIIKINIVHSLKKKKKNDAINVTNFCELLYPRANSLLG